MLVTKNFKLQKKFAALDSREKKSVSTENDDRQFVSDAEVMEMSKKFIERNKNVYAELAKWKF